jgi:hypothetical protein
VETNHRKLLMQIVIGSAWVDGHLYPGEIDYLTKLLKHYHLEDNAQLRELTASPVSVLQTEQWMAAYLEDTTETERQEALAAIANLLIADNLVSDAEHQLLDDFYAMMATIPPHPEATPTIVETTGKFVRKLIQSLSDLVSGN